MDFSKGKMGSGYGEKHEDFWTYMKANNILMESYCVDGTFRGKYSSAQYLIDKYNITPEEAYVYLNSIPCR